MSSRPHLSRVGTALCGTVLVIAFLGACRERPLEGALVVTQAPARGARLAGKADILDRRYPPGSRVVLVSKVGAETRSLVLSPGLLAAGGPVVSPDGQRILFAGRGASEDWQIYEANLRGAKPRRITSMKGGAAMPAFINNRKIVFCSLEGTPDLYAQVDEEDPVRLTFRPQGASDPAVLRDGRILFASKWSSSNAQGLFTINNDGTELTPFALDRDGAAHVERPRESSNGRILFVARNDREAWGESVRLARPFATRERLDLPPGSCVSIEPAEDDSILACLAPAGKSSSVIARLKGGSAAQVAATFDDPAWNEIEAVPVLARTVPMGHISAVLPGKRTGTILCLDANFTRRAAGAKALPRAVRVRVLSGDAGRPQPLGEVPLQPDGSFMAEVPADQPIGFESLTAEGQVLQRIAPSIWVRPGENRTCLGCHEPYNRSPRNLRPMAVTSPPHKFGVEPRQIARGNP